MFFVVLCLILIVQYFSCKKIWNYALHNPIFAPLLTEGGISSAGRALAWHARGHRFESVILHLKFLS